MFQNFSKMFPRNYMRIYVFSRLKSSHDNVLPVAEGWTDVAKEYENYIHTG